MSDFAHIGRFNGGAGPQLLAAHILCDIGSNYNISTLPSLPVTARSPGVCATPQYDFAINKTARAVSIRQIDTHSER
ncbi:hypothetical protein B0T14DRAFT_561721 [Immersiella caudata]|uniref:Uncharacterized protein n=1 Tax=Immersiella caudata TaxID=314043 RepID=A0AA40CE96_9PEZI|nr:hypothetical protein B0T14DRAFT_561721 [Immersiella caudata]